MNDTWDPNALGAYLHALLGTRVESKDPYVHEFVALEVDENGQYVRQGLTTHTITMRDEDD